MLPTQVLAMRGETRPFGKSEVNFFQGVKPTLFKHKEIFKKIPNFSYAINK